MTYTEELLAQRVNIVTASRKQYEKAEAEKRPMSKEEHDIFDKGIADVLRIDAQIKSIRQLDESERFLTESAGRRTSADSGTPTTARAEMASGKPPEARTIKFRGREITIPVASPDYARATTEYEDSFRQYLLKGETRGLKVSDNTKGGYLAPVEFSSQIIKFLDDAVFMRRLANVLPPLTSAVSLGVPSFDTDVADADWTAEVPAADISEDDTMRFGKRELTPHLDTKLIKMSMKLMRTSVLSVDTLVRDRLGYKFAITEEKAFLLGTGAQQPLGVFIADSNGVSTARDVVSGVAGALSFNADDLHNLKYSLKGPYQSRATWLFHRDSVKILAKLKDSTLQYLWQPSIQDGQPDRLMGRPVVMSEYVPNTFTVNKYVGMLADFKTGYWIVDSLAMEVQALDQLFALRNQVGLLGRKETDGMPVLEEAFARLKLAAA